MERKIRKIFRSNSDPLDILETLWDESIPTKDILVSMKKYLRMPFPETVQKMKSIEKCKSWAETSEEMTNVFFETLELETHLRATEHMGNPIKVYLDDERETPDGWVRAYWPDEVITLLKKGNVTDVSLDHDLGDDERGTGYDVLLWIEEAVATQNFSPPHMRVHSANSSARDKMEMAIRTINRLADQ